MSVSERNYGSIEDTFSLSVDQYGRLWLHTKMEGIPVSIDLASKDAAFEIMAGAMAENGFEYHPVQPHGEAVNDDETGRGEPA
jgi:hypothetical protein